jgi:hypothetical protein
VLFPEPARALTDPIKRPRDALKHRERDGPILELRADVLERRCACPVCLALG